MEADRVKWDARYGGDDYLFSFTPSRFLTRSMNLVSSLVPGRRALDIACGEGRNAIFLAQNGFRVSAVDISERGLDKGRARAAELGVQVDFLRADLEGYRLEGEYDLIVDFNFLLRPLIPAMIDALAPGGVVVMETLLDVPELQGGHNKEFLLQPGELERMFSGRGGSVLVLEEERSEAMPVARLLFRKG